MGNYSLKVAHTNPSNIVPEQSKPRLKDEITEKEKVNNSKQVAKKQKNRKRNVYESHNIRSVQKNDDVGTEAKKLTFLVYEVLSVIAKDSLLVELFRDDKIFKIGTIHVTYKNEDSKYQLIKLETGYEIQELNIDFPNIKRGFVTVLDSSSNYLLLLNNQQKELHIFYKVENGNQFTFEKATVIKNMKLKTSYIDKNEEKNDAFVVLFDESIESIIIIHKFSIKNNNCEHETQKIILKSEPLDKYFNCLFTSKSNYLVAWNYNRNTICYFDLLENNHVCKNFDGLKIDDLTAIPNTDDLLVLNNNKSLDYFEIQNNSNGIKELKHYKDMITCSGKLNVLRVIKNYLFLFQSESPCEIYDLINIERKQIINQPDFKIPLKEIDEDGVYVSRDAKHFIFTSVEVNGIRNNYKFHFFEITNDSELKEVEINKSKLTRSNENFTDFIELENCIIMIKDNEPYIIYF